MPIRFAKESDIPQILEIYRPYVDFDGVEALAAVEASRLLSWMA